MKQALKDGYTLQFYGIQVWFPDVASLAAQLTRKTLGRPGKLAKNKWALVLSLCLALSFGWAIFFLHVR